MAAHLSVDELADASAGLVDDARAAEIAEHLAACGRCADSMAEVEQVSVQLAAEPTPAMPAELSRRLTAVIDDEQSRRTSGRAATAAEHRQELAARSKPSLGSVGSDLKKPSRRTFLTRAVAACIASAAIGLGGYAVGARAGLGEPQAVRSPLSSSSLAPQAEQLRSNTDLDNHWLSQAWSCAREVTDGRIVDLARVTYDGSPALLVYQESGGQARVTVVTGCPDDPHAETTTELPR